MTLYGRLFQSKKNQKMMEKKMESQENEEQQKLSSSHRFLFRIIECQHLINLKHRILLFM